MQIMPYPTSKKNQPLKAQGFTLLEILVALSVVAILIGISLPRSKGLQDQSKVVQAKADLQLLKSLVRRYSLDHSGSLPANITTALTSGSPAPLAAKLIDPFSPTGDTYKYTHSGDYFIISSCGMDKVHSIGYMLASGKVLLGGDDIYVTNSNQPKLDLNTDMDNCGTIGFACTGGSSCSGGACRCASGGTINDPNNCGTCGYNCQALGDSGATCSSGSCQCSGGYSDFGSGCQDIYFDTYNCGSPGYNCQNYGDWGAYCDSGSCQCDGGWTDNGNGCVSGGSPGSPCDPNNGGSDCWSYNCSSAGTITITDATYGGNCWADDGNVTGMVASMCDGQTSCSFNAGNGTFGDPCGGCNKQCSVTYTCSYGGSYSISDTGEGQDMTVSCSVCQ